ncbi:hypothetical protein [uncultured Jannaschia sp.]|uniref:hypothetical protein n=1 Tax=uncultured Jannaschia sp. TaxID=293347 RepID=UPI002635E4E9|nr:hypothetical protein [uncultured Jannaschia sp.]
MMRIEVKSAIAARMGAALVAHVAEVQNGRQREALLTYGELRRRLVANGGSDVIERGMGRYLTQLLDGLAAAGAPVALPSLVVTKKGGLNLDAYVHHGITEETLETLETERLRALRYDWHGTEFHVVG